MKQCIGLFTFIFMNRAVEFFDANVKNSSR